MSNDDPQRATPANNERQWP